VDYSKIIHDRVNSRKT